MTKTSDAVEIKFTPFSEITTYRSFRDFMNLTMAYSIFSSDGRGLQFSDQIVELGDFRIRTLHRKVTEDTEKAKYFDEKLNLTRPTNETCLFRVLGN